MQAEDNKTLEGSIAVVTGAARSIGLACARRMAEQGATVVMTDIDSDEGRARCEELKTAGLHVDFQSLDVASEEGWQALLDHVLADYGRLDVLVNNEGPKGVPENYNPYVVAQKAPGENGHVA